MRTDDRSRFSAPASSSMRYIAGTPMKIDAWRCSIASRTSSAPKPRQEVHRDAGARQTQDGDESHDVRDRKCEHGLASHDELGRQRAGDGDLTNERLMRQLDTLRLARRTRRVEESGDILRFEGLRLRERLGTIDGRRGSDDKRRRRVIDDVTHLVGAHVRIHRNGNAAGP